ncbi:hypothetical protein [Dickeya sp. Secpp 1600]|uniref:hypothetical protein n=1 Tax=Dickeya sp. Secpp 1600 TaxID=2037915 RepID=UPI000D326535|nr:hypothetical protein [Dickeya sp. Secpp 1600]
MNLHVELTSQFALSRQYWQGLSASMQLHENCYIKRAGVAGAQLRAISFIYSWGKRRELSLSKSMISD